MPRFADYRARMESAAARWFADRALSTHARIPYLLRDRDGWPENLVDPTLARLVEEEMRRRAGTGATFALHQYVHHGLSSQAMLFNLVLPLVRSGRVDDLRAAFVAAGAPWPGPGAGARLEVEDRTVFLESAGQPTSLDLAIEGPHGPPLFVESKLIEQGFGGCSVLAGGDCDGSNPARDPGRCPLHRWGRSYWTRLGELGFLSGELADSPLCLLGPHYQFFREAAFALARGGHFVLLVHGENPAFQDPRDPERGLWPFLLRFVPEEHRPRLHRVTLQAVVAVLEEAGGHEDWLRSFRAKYALDESSKPGLETGPGSAAAAVAADVPAPEEVERALASLGPGVAGAIRALWEQRIRGGRARNDRGARAAQQQVSVLLREAGIARDDPRWALIIGHGRALYGAGDEGAG